MRLSLFDSRYIGIDFHLEEVTVPLMIFVKSYNSVIFFLSFFLSGKLERKLQLS